MELAIKEAKKAALRDEIPIGAIIKGFWKSNRKRKQ